MEQEKREIKAEKKELEEGKKELEEGKRELEERKRELEESIFFLWTSFFSFFFSNLNKSKEYKTKQLNVFHSIIGMTLFGWVRDQIQNF